MTTVSFLDSIFSQFIPLHWQSGVSIYRSGGVINFQIYGELITARIKAGVGENYDVRMKIQSNQTEAQRGRFVQWIECTCQANRRKNEKCGHIAAFYVFLDKEKSNLLEHFGFAPSDDDKYLRQDSLKLLLNSNNVSGGIERSVLPSEFLPNIDNKNLEGIFESKDAEILSISMDKEPPWVNVLVKIRNLQKLTYRFGIDDTCRILFNPTYTSKADESLSPFIHHKWTAKRFFEIKKAEKLNIIINKIIQIYEYNTIKKISLIDIQPQLIGKYGVFLKKIGFIPFTDSMTPSQISRWQEYPKVASIEEETAAALIETEFSRLKETADVIVDDSLKKISIFNTYNISEYSVKQSIDGSIFIDANIDLKENKNKSFIGKISELLKARAEGKKYLSTKDGFIKINGDLDWLKSNIQDNGTLKLNSIEFIKFHTQHAEKSKITGKSDLVDRIRKGLISPSELETPSLLHSNLDLRPYQVDGLRWLWWLYKNQLSGLLADEMGLGKTHQAMALLQGISNTEKEACILIVCPTSVMDHWLDKMSKFVSNIKAICYHGIQRKKLLILNSKEKNTVVYVTSYGVLLRDFQELSQISWNVIILDEAHLVKNQSTRTYKAACRLSSRMRLCLTGTPLENDLMELKNLFDYLIPNYLGKDSEFKKKYLLSEHNDPMSDANLHRLIHPFKLRRNKIDVLTDLPEKVEDIRYCNLTPSQKAIYEEVLSLKGSKLIEDLENNVGPIPYIHVFSLITMLKQICNDPALIDSAYENLGSGKLQLLDELLSEAMESNYKVVIFSQYAKMIQRLSVRLHKKSIQHVVLTGQTIKRGAVVKEFQENDNIKVFLGSLLAGGTGIDLTAANIVIHFDRWWNAAKENQATDRIHRIGQTKNVQVFKLITKGTLEERIDEIISRKRMIFERFVELDEDVFKHLSREDLLQLLKLPVSTNTSAEVDDENNVEIYDI